MALQTETALAALKTALTGLASLPAECRRNDLSLQGFEASGTANVKFKLMMADDDIDVGADVLGEPLTFELGVGAEIIFAVEGQPGADRDTVFAAGVEALALALWPVGVDGVRRPLQVANAFDDLQPIGGAQRQHIMGDQGGLPIETLRLQLALITNAPTPLG